eukprot:2595371-Rhodomonas_salina.2
MTGPTAEELQQQNTQQTLKSEPQSDENMDIDDGREHILVKRTETLCTVTKNHHAVLTDRIQAASEIVEFMNATG